MSYVLGTVDRTASDFVANFNVRRGSKGPAVLYVQTALNVFGAKPALKVDSIFGPLTEAAVRGFQEANGLTVDGIVGPQTSLALQDDESREIGSKKSTTLPVTTLPRAKKSNTMLIVGGLALAGVIGVVIAMGGARANPSRRRRRRGNWLYGARTKAEALRIARKRRDHSAIRALTG